MRDRVRLQNRTEALLEEMRIKLSGEVSDLFGAIGRRILEALAGGETDPPDLGAHQGTHGAGIEKKVHEGRCQKRSFARAGSRPAAMAASSSSTPAAVRCGGSCMTRRMAAADAGAVRYLRARAAFPTRVAEG